MKIINNYVLTMNNNELILCVLNTYNYYTVINSTNLYINLLQ